MLAGSNSQTWREYSNLEAEKQGPVIVLSLDSEAQDTILELDPATFLDEIVLSLS